MTSDNRSPPDRGATDQRPPSGEAAVTPRRQKRANLERRFVSAIERFGRHCHLAPATPEELDRSLDAARALYRPACRWPALLAIALVGKVYIRQAKRTGLVDGMILPPDAGVCVPAWAVFGAAAAYWDARVCGTTLDQEVGLEPQAGGSRARPRLGPAGMQEPPLVADTRTLLEGLGSAAGPEHLARELDNARGFAEDRNGTWRALDALVLLALYRRQLAERCGARRRLILRGDLGLFVPWWIARVVTGCFDAYRRGIRGEPPRLTLSQTFMIKRFPSGRPGPGAPPESSWEGERHRDQERRLALLVALYRRNGRDDATLPVREVLAKELERRRRGEHLPLQSATDVVPDIAGRYGVHPNTVRAAYAAYGPAADQAVERCILQLVDKKQ